MSELWDAVDRMVAGMARAQAAAERSRKRVEARRWVAKVCGNCTSWMKSSECPREHNVNGRNRGPSCADIACDKFTLEPRNAAEMERELADIAAQEESDQ